MKNSIFSVLVCAIFMAIASQAIAATPQQKCQAGKNRAAARYTSCSFRAESGISDLYSLRRCRVAFEKQWKTIIRSASRQRVSCFDAPLRNTAYKAYIHPRVNLMTTFLGKREKNLNAAQRKCRVRKTIEVGRYAYCRQSAEGTLARTGDTTAYNLRIGQCESSFQREWQQIIDDTTEKGTTCFDNSRSVGEYKIFFDTQTSKVARVLAGTDLFNPISITVSGSPLSLNAGGVTGVLTITNISPRGSASEVTADFSETALLGNVTVAATTCSSFAPGASCTLTLQTNNTVVPMTAFKIKGVNTAEAGAVLTITTPPAVISLTGSPLQLTTGGSDGVISITNISSISSAKNITASFVGSALDGNVTVSANTCSDVAPGTGCTLTFTPGNTVVGETNFSIQGDDTNTLSAAIALATPQPTTATLSLSGSPLQLETNGSTDVLILTNTSTSVTAANITSDFTGSALDGNVTETGNTCSSVVPGASCTLTFTPGSTVVAPTSFTIQGTNTTSLSASIQIISSVVISGVGPSSGPASGGTGVTVTGTGLTGATNVTFDGVGATSVNVVNSTTLTAVAPAHAAGVVDVVVTTPSGSGTVTSGFTFIVTTVGQSTYGGVIGCLNGGLNNLIAAVADNSAGITWGGLGVTTGASSTTDGATNTATVTATLGVGTYAASICNDHEIDSQGNAPCEAGNACYNDWFLPAGNNLTSSGQLNCLYTNGNSIGGFASSPYWSSTEGNATNSWATNFSNGSQVASAKNNALRVRCVRAFTP